MAPSSVSQDRIDMATASAELAKNLRTLAARFDRTPEQSKEVAALAYHTRRLAAIFDRLELAAKSDQPIHSADLRTLGRAFCDAATQIHEAAELVDFLKSATAVEGLGQRIARVGDLTAQALTLAGVKLS